MARIKSLAVGSLLLLALGVLGGCGTPAPVAPVEALESGIVEADRAYKIEDILGIGPVYGAKLREAGVTNTQKLLDATTTRYKRQKLAEQTGIPYKHVLSWAQKVELMKIRGIGPRQSNLLAAIGVASARELAQRDPENLHDRLARANAFSPNFVDRTPSLNTVSKWVSAAKDMPKSVSSDQ